MQPVPEVEVVTSLSTETGRFAQVDLAVIADKSLTPGEKIIYSAIAMHRNHRTGEAFPARATVAEMAGCTPEYVSRVTTRLVRLEATGDCSSRRRER